jgi:hypothetical protein
MIIIICLVSFICYIVVMTKTVECICLDGVHRDPENEMEFECVLTCVKLFYCLVTILVPALIMRLYV